MTGSVSRAHFDALYASNPDPWSFETSTYENAKYDATIAALGGQRFGSALEIGCSIGVLTQKLAPHCDALLAIDVADAAVAQARRRCAALAHVQFARMQVPLEWPDGAYDLIMLSEVLYYFVPTDLDAVCERALGAARPAATILLVHWIGPNDAVMPGDEAVDRFISGCAPHLTPRHQHRTDRYRLDLLR